MGCAACHGAEGSGGINNLNYVLDTVPPLNEMADRLMLFDPEDAVAAVELLERGTDLASLEQAPPFPDYARFAAQYGAVVGVIKNGAPAAKKDPNGITPPLQMPAWAARLSDNDIRALIAYLIELYDWEEV
jgi:mono/diheme cytochrome c family protein